MLRSLVVLAGLMVEVAAFSGTGGLSLGGGASAIGVNRRSSGVVALRSTAESSRRDFLRDLAVLGASFAMPSAAFAVKAKTGLASVYTGEYSDPNHPGCKREIKVVGASLGVDGKRSRLPGAIVLGRDSSSGAACTGDASEAAWKLKGRLNDDGDIFIDFSPKGGPKDLIGKWDKDGIVFPDGNKWTKL